MPNYLVDRKDVCRFYCAMLHFSTLKFGTLLLSLLILIELCLVCCDHTVFSYPHYPYRKKKPSERKIKNVKSRCDIHTGCEQKSGLEHTECVRSCMSERCYEEIYAFDPLEEGEIDIRYNSFKGCILEDLKKLPPIVQVYLVFYNKMLYIALFK